MKINAINTYSQYTNNKNNSIKQKNNSTISNPQINFQRHVDWDFKKLNILGRSEDGMISLGESFHKSSVEDLKSAAQSNNSAYNRLKSAVDSVIRTKKQLEQKLRNLAPNSEKASEIQRELVRLEIKANEVLEDFTKSSGSSSRFDNPFNYENMQYP